ncbi:WD40-repeat-containing domain protein [Lasiosphaeria ovina]|uniref:WD40-repeat-containing domain protein n=1 Tax=Lasiosphaeria ovina TaxID=92902 RepID=A0AAE0K8Z8_9PEZI|nr:WD40-repeat-containing domain protein [Lasiosphaeria ovina]
MEPRLGADDGQEPPAKRPRFSEQPQFDADSILAKEQIPTEHIKHDELIHCLRTQVFTHVDRELAKLPPGVHNTQEIGRKVINTIIDPTFSAMLKLGRGKISDQFEKYVSDRIEWDVQNLANLPEHKVYPEPPPHRVWPAFYQRSFKTPVPIPQVPRWPAASPSVANSRPFPVANGISSLPVLRYSHSPIPLPAVPPGPGRVSAFENKETSGLRPSGYTIVNKSNPNVIIISDDDDDEVPRGLAASSPAPPACAPVPPPALVRASSPLPSPALDQATAAPSSAKQPDSTIRPAPAVIRDLRPRTPRASVKNRASLATSPQNFRSRAHASLWRGSSGPNHDSRGKDQTASQWFSSAHRPYLQAEVRETLLAGTQSLLRLDQGEVNEFGELEKLSRPVVFHVDFSPDEVENLRTMTRQILKLSANTKRDAKKDLAKVLSKNFTHARKIASAVARSNKLPRRDKRDIARFIRDAINSRTAKEPAILSLQRDDYDQAGSFVRCTRTHSLLFAREISGQRGRLLDLKNEFMKCLEDSLELRLEWTDCAGDIATITWVSNDNFVCGTTEHSDAHNQQYNKPGNLALGACSKGTLRAFPHHRVVRPIVSKGENSTAAMRESQDPWLYSSVVSSDYDAIHDRAFTSGFDRTVKIWSVDKSGSSMGLTGEWAHDGNVNFVAASKHESGLVATAADVAADAVRIYWINDDDISASAFRSYSCSRVTDAEGNAVSTEKWAYFPATMQWGLSPDTRHLLLIGYSPRSRTTDDSDIPEDRMNTGELCLWNGLTGERWRVMSATTSNIFEVLWHPTQDCFIAATSPLGFEVDPRVRTQIRVFCKSDVTEFQGKAFSSVKTLDCTAIDINELTIMPNGPQSCYVTAGCTDGNTYVWDTALGDKPTHTLRHGHPIDDYTGEREQEDVGVKFTAWGTTPDRFYTGSSDGVVKVWNIRSLKEPLVRDLLEAPGPISCGMFSPDRKRLVVGDATGRVFMLSLDDEEQTPASFMKVQLPNNRARTVRRPIPVILHPDPAPPAFDAAGNPTQQETGSSRAKAYLESQQLERHSDPTIGVVQGPRYAETGMFRAEAHLEGDPTQPLLAGWGVHQQEDLRAPCERRHNGVVMALRPVPEKPDLARLHLDNTMLDLDVDGLDESTRRDLESAGVDLDELMNPGYVFDYDDDDALSEDEF